MRPNIFIKRGKKRFKKIACSLKYLIVKFKVVLC